MAFDAIGAAQSRNAAVAIIDTAGRLHTKFNLMEELRKVRRVIERKDPTAPHEVLLVLDATVRILGRGGQRPNLRLHG